MKISIVLCAILYLIINIATANLMDAHEMQRSFIRGQCVVGAICANLFYFPAWILKGIRGFVVAVIK